MKNLWLARIAVVTLMLVGGMTTAMAASIQDFIGIYRGATINTAGSELQARDLGVSISRTDKGFTVEGTTVIYKKSGEKKVDFQFEFVPSEKQNTWGAAMRRNMFGAMVPLDPLKGEPFVWATLVERTLKVHMLIIPEDGGYEIQVFDRTLSEDGNEIHLDFSRFRDGVALRKISGELTRVPY